MKVNNYDDLEYIYKFDDKKEKEKVVDSRNNDLDKTAFEAFNNPISKSGSIKSDRG